MANMSPSHLLTNRSRARNPNYTRRYYPGSMSSLGRYYYNGYSRKRDIKRLLMPRLPSNLAALARGNLVTVLSTRLGPALVLELGTGRALMFFYYRYVSHDYRWSMRCLGRDVRTPWLRGKDLGAHITTYLLTGDLT